MKINSKLDLFKYIYSSVLLVFCGVLIVGVIFTEQTELSLTNPWLALVVLAVSITWLTMVEGGQGAIVGLGPVDPKFFKDTHKYAHICTSTVHKGDNLDRYLLGRQFMVILIVFTVEMAGAATHFDSLWGLPGWVTAILLSSGLGMILFTCMVGQLNSEVNGCHCMLDYINNWFAVFTVYVALAIEFTGILHMSYLVQKGVAYLAGKPIQSNEPPRNFFQNVFFWGRCLMSVAILTFSFIVTLKALFAGQTKMWEFVPPAVSVVLFLVLLLVIGLLEGSQIAYFAVTKLQEHERGQGYFAKKTCEVLFRNNNHNLAAFMIGRQLCVVSCMFIIARITSVQLKEGDENIFGVSDGIQNLFNTGLLGALCVALVGSIPWRLISSAFPIPFLSILPTYVLLRFCLFLEMTGLLHGAWVLAAIHKKVAHFHRDEFYIGTAEERARVGKKDDESVYEDSRCAAHMFPGLAKLPSALEGRTETIDGMMELEKELQDQLENVQARIQIHKNRQKQITHTNLSDDEEDMEETV